MAETEGSPSGAGPVEDPGWGFSSKDAVGLVFPPLLLLRHGGGGGKRLRSGGRPPILVLRLIFVVIVQALVALFVVLVFVLPFNDPVEDLSPVVYAALAVGLSGPAGAWWARQRTLECGDLDHLARQYATAFFVGVALTESAALFGFVASFLAGGWWPYLVGVALSAIGFALIAPTEAHVARSDRRVMTSGCATSLREALFTTRGQP